MKMKLQQQQRQDFSSSLHSLSFEPSEIKQSAPQNWTFLKQTFLQTNHYNINTAIVQHQHKYEQIRRYSIPVHMNTITRRLSTIDLMDNTIGNDLTHHQKKQQQQQQPQRRVRMINRH